MAEKIGNIRDVARATGLSTATVSRVMNGNPKVNAEMRERVLDAAARLNYVPNPAARALSTNRSRTVAAIIPTIEHSVYAKYITALERALDAKGYTLVLAISNADPVQELDAAEKLIAMGAEAFILTGQDHSTALTALLARRRTPTVLTSVFDPQSAIPTIGYDNKALATQAVRYLIGFGHQRIAVVHGPLQESDRTALRRDGVRAALPDLSDSALIEVDLSVEGGRIAAKKVAEMPQRPSAVLCFSDVLALGMMFHFQSIGLRVPDDISIMGFDNLDWSKDSYPSLTTIDLPAAEMGEKAAKYIVAQLEKTEFTESLALNAHVIGRNSVAFREP